MATNYDDFTRKKNQTALERYYQLKNGRSNLSAGDTLHSQSSVGMTEIAGRTVTQGEAAASAKEEKKNKGGLFGGIGYLGHELGLGVLRSVEGVVDYTVGGILDLFGADDEADKMLKNDWVNYNAADEWYNPGKGWEFVGDVASGVGGMLPAVALTAATGGTAGAVLGSTMFGVGAAGQSVAEQTKKNGSAGGKEWLYGTGSGLLETGIELASGGIGGTAAGKVLGKTLAKSTGGKIATSFIGEGLEEVASDILDPALQRVTGVDKNAKVDWGNLPRTFLVGGTTGAVMGGGQQVLKAAQAGGFNNLNAMETAQEMQERMSDNNVRQALGKKEIYTQKDIAEARDRLSANLKRMDEGTRAAFLKQVGPRVSSFFNADGTVKQEVWENIRPTAQTGARYSIKNVGGKNIVSIDTDQNVFEGVARKDYGKVARDYIKSHFRGNSVNDVAFKARSEGEYVRSDYSQQLYRQGDSLYETKMKGATELDNFVRTGELLGHEEAKHPRSFNEGGYDRYAVEFELGGESFSGEMLVALDKNSQGMFYDIVNIKEKKANLPTFESQESKTSTNSPSINSISEKVENVNSFSQKSVKSNSQSIANLIGETYSASLKGRESTLKYQPAASTQGTAHARAALRNIELLSGGRVDVVLTDELMTTADGQTANGEYADGVLYVNANADSYERAMFIASHELTHSLEGTEQYGRLGAFIREQINGNSDFAKKYDLEKYRSAYARAQEGDFSAETLDYQAETEMYADFVAKEILGNEEVVRRLVAKERNIAIRFLEWVRSALRRLGMSKEESAEYTTLKKAEKLLSAALENAKGGVSLEEVEEDVQRMKALREMFAQEGEGDSSATRQNDSTEKKETTEENSVDVGAPAARYLIKQFDADSYDYEQNIKAVAKMKSIANLQGDEFIIGKQGLYDEINSYFNSINNNAYNDELGDVELKRRGIKDSVAHGLGELKTVAFKAVPKIIEKGKIVDYQKKWKGHEYDTAVIAAPVTIASEEYYAVVVVRRTQVNQRFYLHEIDIKKRQTVQTEATTTNSSTQELGGLPINSIFEKLRNVNTSDEKISKKSSRKSLDVEEKPNLVPYLRNYLHRLNISEETKADIIQKYGEKTAKRLFNVWENATGREDGVDIATAHQALWREGFRTYSEYEEDFLMDMDTTMRGRAPKMYEKAEKGKAIEAADEKSVLRSVQDGRKTKNEDSTKAELTDRQTEYLARYTKKKVFTKQEAETIINNILDGYMNYEEEVGSMHGKTREEVVKMLWRALNSADAGKRTGVARKIADYIMQHTVMENIYSDSIVQMHTDTIEVLKPYLHKLDLDGIKGDIKYHYGDNSPYALWGKRKGESGIGVDVAAMELNEQGFYIEEINPVDIFLRIDDAYRKAVEGVKTKTKKFATEIIEEKEQKALRDDMVKAILRAFDSHGSPSALTEMIREYDKKVQGWKDRYYEERDRNNLTARVLYKVQKLKDFEKGTFANAAEFKRDIFKNTIGRLGRIKYRGNLNKSGTRKILAGLLEWYDNKNNPMLEGDAYNEDIVQMLMQLADNFKPMTTAQYELLAKLEEKSKKYDFKSLAEWYTRENIGKEYSAGTKEWLNDLADPTEFSSEELKNLERVIDYFRNFMENYNKVYRAGKYVEATPLAQKYVAQMQNNKHKKVGWVDKLFGGLFKGAKRYLQAFGDPMTVARYFDKYENGFFTEALEDLRKGAIQAQVMEQRLRAPLEEFYDKHKKFLEDSEKREIEYQGEKMNAQTAMLLYMTLKREQALRGLAYSGFKFKRGDYTVTVPGFATAENLDIDELKMQAAELQNELAKQFNESEREYIAIVERIFNEDCKKAKSETDMARMGYTNILEGYYVPIRRASIAYNVEKQSYRDEVASVSDQSFNKDTVTGARNQLFIDGLTGVFEKHVGGISQYASLAMALDNYNVLFNLNVSGNPNTAISVKSEAENVWADGGKYFSEIIEDIKGIRKSTGVGHEWMSRIRGSYAKYQLGANPKVWVTQLSSFAAAVNILDPDCIIGGMGVKVDGKVLDEYCGLAMVRNNENTAAIAQGVLEKTTNKIGDVLMKPIGMVDRFVVSRLFGACQTQVQKNGGAKVGTAENLKAAGELLERVILETQQNAMATEKSAAMRSGSEFVKSLTMFSADSMKLTGRVIDAIGETAVLRNRIKVETDATVKAALNKKLAAANKQACRAIASIVLQAVFMTAIAELFKWLYNKDDEDDNKVKAIVTDTLGNMISGLPAIRDVVSFFSDGYEVESFAYASINDLLTAVGDARDVAAAKLAGENVDDRKMALTLRKVMYAAGQLTGIPTRNIYNVVYGLTNRISPETGYKWNDKFYKSSYRADLAAAIEKGDDEMIATIVGLMLNENVGGVTDAAAREAIDALVIADYDVIPRSVPDKVTYKVYENGTEETKEIELTAKQTQAFEKIYTVANEKVASLVKSSQYKRASQEVQAKAIKFIYDTYYTSAKGNLTRTLTGEGLSKNELFAEAIDIDKLAIIIAEARLIESDKKNGVTVSGSKKAKVQKYVNSLRLTAVQKYMIMGYLGYKNVNGAAQVQACINRLKLSETAKNALYEYSGY